MAPEITHRIRKAWVWRCGVDHVYALTHALTRAESKEEYIPLYSYLKTILVFCCADDLICF